MKMQMMMVVALGMFVSLSSFADRTFTLVDNQSGARFQCDQGGGGNGGGGNSDPRCVENVSNYCYNNTSYGRNTCFEKAGNACRGGGSGFSDCVSSSANYCYNNTSYGRNDCFDRAVSSCSGNFEAIRELVEGAKLKAVDEARVRF